MGGFIEFVMSTYIAISTPIAETTFANEEFEVIDGEAVSFYGAILAVVPLIAIVCASGWLIFKTQA